MSSEPLFKAVAILEVPEGITLEQLQERLEKLADDLIVEIDVVVHS
jgi:glycine cleavage system regulatory protein